MCACELAKKSCGSQLRKKNAMGLESPVDMLALPRMTPIDNICIKRGVAARASLRVPNLTSANFIQILKLIFDFF